MELNSLYYFSELAKDLNMTRTAQRLFISQQTLSNHIARLEDYYGTRLFNRKPALSLTPAGRTVLAFAENTSLENERLKNELSDILGLESGTLRIGGNYVRLHAFITRRLHVFMKRYPRVFIEVQDMMTTPQLENGLLKNELDIAAVIRGKEHRRLLYQPVMTDEIFLCVSDSLLRTYYGNEAETIRERSIRYGANLKDFEKLPFYLFDNVRGRQIDTCFEEAGIVPNVAIRGVYTHNATELCYQGMVASFLSRLNLTEPSRTMPPDLGVYRLLYRGKPLAQEILLARNRDNYVPRYADYLWELMKTSYGEIGAIPLESRLPD